MHMIAKLTEPLKPLAAAVVCGNSRQQGHEPDTVHSKQHLLAAAGLWRLPEGVQGLHQAAEAQPRETVPL